MLEAVADGSVQQRHFEAVWRAYHRPLRASLISEAHVHRARRLSGLAPPEYASTATRATRNRASRMSAAAAAATILSYLPEEFPPEDTMDILLDDGVYPFDILSEAPMSDPYFPVEVRGSIITRIIGTPDAMELRDEIWGPAASRISSV
jgi:hypothetical protein